MEKERIFSCFSKRTLSHKNLADIFTKAVMPEGLEKFSAKGMLSNNKYELYKNKELFTLHLAVRYILDGNAPRSVKEKENKMAKVEFNVGIEYIAEVMEKSFRFHNQIMDSINMGSDTFLPVLLHEEYKESMELLMQDCREKYLGIRTYLIHNMNDYYVYIPTGDELEEEKLLVLKEIDTAFEDKGIYKSRGLLSPYNQYDMVKTVHPYQPSEAIKRMNKLM